ncbi:MAG: hypothetical protein ACOYBU_18395 [Dermatophilaceae bacterium]
MADEFDRGDYEVVDGATQVVESETADTGTAVLSVRLPRSAIAALKQAAAEEEIGATVLARRWLMERLTSEAPPSSGTVEVTDLLEWLQTRVTQQRAGRVVPPGPQSENPAGGATS